MLLNILSWIFSILMIGGVIAGTVMIVWLAIAAIKEDYRVKHPKKCCYTQLEPFGYDSPCKFIGTKGKEPKDLEACEHCIFYR